MSDSELQNLVISKIYEASPEGILVVDDNNVIVSHNRQFVDIWRIPAELLTGSVAGTAIGNDDAPVLSVVLGSVKDSESFLAQVKELYDNPHLNDQREIELMDGRTVERHSTVINSSDGRYLGRVWFFRDISKRKNAERRLLELNEQLESAQNQLLQSEKMASIGQLAAGVAHEINNPVGFVNSNLGTLSRYIVGLFQVIDAYAAAETRVGAGSCPEVDQIKKAVDFPYLIDDIPKLLIESQDGLARVTRIVQDLKDFSHVDESNWQYANLEQGMDSTLNVVNNEIKYKAEVIREYVGLPEVECIPSQLNQVFLNLLMNATQAIDNKGVITVRTGITGDEIWVEVEDTGKGVAPEHLSRIFDPFFTTKPVGKGTGLGLSLSYGIVQKHHGRIEVNSSVGKGTTFRIWLPLSQPKLTEH